MPDATAEVSRRRLTVATSVQLGVRLVGAMLGVLVAASLARALTHAEFGELTLTLTLLALTQSLGDLGITQIAIREMAHAPERRAGITGALMVGQLTTGIVLGAAGVTIAFVLMHGTSARVMAALMMATLPLSAVSAYTTAAQARLRPEISILPTLVQNLVWLAVVLVLGDVRGSLALYGAGLLFAGVVQAGFSAALSRRLTEVQLTGTGATILRLLRQSWPIGLAGMFVTAYYRIDGILLFHYRGASSSGFYSAGYRVLDVLQLLPVTISGVLLPLLAAARRTEDGSRERTEAGFRLGAIVLLTAAMPIALCGGLLAPEIVRLVYGRGFGSTVPLLQVLLPSFIPICMGYLLTGQLILHGMLRPYIACTAAGAALNIAVNLIGIPRAGAAVAAWSTLGTELLVMGLIATVVARRLGLLLPFGRIGRCAAAACAAAVPVWAVRHDGLALGIVVALVAYPPCVLASRALTITELRALITRDVAAIA